MQKRKMEFLNSAWNESFCDLFNDKKMKNNSNINKKMLCSIYLILFVGWYS